MNEIIEQLEELQKEIGQATAKLGLNNLRQKMGTLERQMQAPDFWSDQKRATQISKEHATLSNQIADWDDLAKQVADAMELAKTNDHKLERALKDLLAELKAHFERKEFELKMSGPYDQNNAILAIHAGTGGTDAMDWAQMLMRMYLRFSERENFKNQVISQTPGDEAGLKNALIKIDGRLAYGRLKGEHGVHRLVRKSPFNSDHLRQTSFALVEVLPELETTAIELDPKDIKFEAFRSSGAGGQSVNKTASAVRLTHLPTGITVAIQNERSQLANRQTATTILAGRLAQLAAKEQTAAISKIKGANIKAEWGAQIRNYVLDPYKLVKDLRSHHETSDVEGVLDGKLNDFIDAYLASQIGR